jgi:hypothetical protein
MPAQFTNEPMSDDLFNSLIEAVWNEGNVWFPPRLLEDFELLIRECRRLRAQSQYIRPRQLRLFL